MMLNVLGHVHLTRLLTTPEHQDESRPIAVPGKSAALLTYLCLEGRAHHREHLAELFWDTPDPLRNLRVELARLKREGVAQFPERQPMLSFQCPLDLSGWLSAATTLNEARLLPWLATLRGLPLSGLEDLGSRQFQQWLDGQRWAISEQLEQALKTAHTQFLREHRLSAAEQIQARAEQLGLKLDAPVPPGSPGLPEPFSGTKLPVHWQCARAEEQVLCQLMASVSAGQQGNQQQANQPQLVLLLGRGGSGKRTLIRRSVQASGWQAIQLQASAQRSLFQAALTQQLWPLLGEEPPPGTRSANPDSALIDLTAGLHRSGQKLVIAIHNAARGLSWLEEVVRFLLDLPLPLIVVLSETLPARLAAVQGRTAFADSDRSHRLDLTPLTPRMVMQAWQEGSDPHTKTTPFPGHRAHATRLVQRSEGWPLHAQALSAQQDQDTLPDVVRRALLGELSALPRAVRAGLSRLSLVHHRFTPELAELLLEADTGQTLLHGIQQGVLVPAAAQEEVTLPGLHYRSDDQTRSLHFASETMRIVLASSITGLERQELRQTLALHFLELYPALSLHHARKAGLDDLVQLAQAALHAASGTPAVPGAAASLGSAASLLNTGQARLEMSRAAPSEEQAAFRRELQTPNGYRVALDCGQLEVMRRGLYGPPPLLRLSAPDVPAGPWVLTARLDTYRDAPTGLTRPTPFALGVQAGGTRLSYLPATDTDTTDASDAETADLQADAVPPLAILPLEQWFTLRGVSRGGPLELSVRAMDVALTVAELYCAGVTVLPVRA